jgi:lipopolysaccharide/colanic/teichoic acid biosynthesis glycosyltransferase
MGSGPTRIGADGVFASAELDIPPPEVCRPAATLALAQRLPRLVVQSLLIAGDVSAYVIAYLLVAPFLPANAAGVALDRILALATLATIVLAASRSLYPAYRILDHEQLRRRATVCLVVATLAISGVLLLPEGWSLAFPILAFLAAGLIIQPFIHDVTRRLCRRLGIWGERAALIAGPNRMPVLLEHFKRHWRLGILPEPVSTHGGEDISDGAPRIALIAGDMASPLEELAAMRRRFAEIILLADIPTLKLTGLRPADIGGQIGLRLAFRGRPAPEIARRALDLAIALLATLLLAPLIGIAAIMIYVIDPGSVFFWHAREGRGGRPLHVLKLRTMYRDAEQRLDTLLRENPGMAAEWSSHFKLRRDPRILPVIGHLLRKTSLDEVPQLLNIITGEMTLVGPRPFPAYHLQAMDRGFRDKRHSVTPGLTGLWQISERSDADIGLQQQLDEFYIDNRSLWLDWHILVSTVPAVFKRGGAY